MLINIGLVGLLNPAIIWYEKVLTLIPQFPQRTLSLRSPLSYDGNSLTVKLFVHEARDNRFFKVTLAITAVGRTRQSVRIGTGKKWDERIS